MPTDNWNQLDTLRERWVFLLLGEEEPSETEFNGGNSISYWEIGVGNAETVVTTKAAKNGYASITSEAELIRALLAELDAYRYDDAILITPTKSVLRLLRRRCVKTLEMRVSLRGFTHIAVADQLEKYFGVTLETQELDQESLDAPRVTETRPKEVASTGSAETVWECWERIFRLLPADEVTGDPV